MKDKEAEGIMTIDLKIDQEVTENFVHARITFILHLDHMKTEFHSTGLTSNSLALHVRFLGMMNIQVNMIYQFIKNTFILLAIILNATIIIMKIDILTCLLQTGLHRWETIRGGVHSHPPC